MALQKTLWLPPWCWPDCVCFDPSALVSANRAFKDKVQYIGELVDREFTFEFFQKVVDAAKANDCLVGINHPVYSRWDAEFISNIKGLDFFEITNQLTCLYDEDDNPYLYDQLLCKGHQLAITASDDNHCAKILDYPTDPRPWAATMIKAESLSHAHVISAMEQGNMYTTQGPEIYELYMEDGEVHMKFSDAKHVIMITSTRRREFSIAEEKQYLNEVVYPIPKNVDYIRMVVVDEYGRKARTRAYFL